MKLKRQLCKIKNLDVRIARCFTFTGEYLDNNKFAIVEFINSIMSKKKIILKSSYQVYRSYMHSKESNLQINYLNKSPEQLKEKEKFDIILNLEIVEHVENLDLYLKSCKDLLKKNGLMFTATINRTLTSYIKAILGAEYILRWLPIGTHDWNKFVKPEELQKKLNKENFTTSDIKGLEFNPIWNKWKRSNNLSVNYIISSIKN